MENEDGCPYDTVCFHCQQACEKYLKALLTLSGIHAPRTHDLEVLVALLPSIIRSRTVALGLSSLNPYAVDVRYADDWRDPQRKDAIHAMQLAAILRDTARQSLPSASL